MNELQIQKASAGSGKTYQLALNYIRLLLGEEGRLFYPVSHYAHREILAVTFTNKATEEMKQRIISELAALADVESKSDYRATLVDEFHTDAATLAKASAQALSDLLYDYTNFNISTIDSFFQSVLRSFAYEADLEGNYDLVLEDKEILILAIEETLRLAISPKAIAANPNIRELRDWLIKYMKELRLQQDSFDLYNPANATRVKLIRFMGGLTNEIYKSNKSAIDDFTVQPKAIDKLEKELRVKFREHINLINQKARDFYSLNCKNKGLSTKTKNFIKKIHDSGMEGYLANPDNFFKQYKEQLADNSLFLDACDVSFHADLRDILHLLRNFFTIVTLQKQIHNYGLFSAINNVADELKRANNTILLSDTNTLLNRIIDDSDTPFIYERVGRKLKHFLIDEFQDTSRLQWSNFRPLIAESLSEGNQNLIIGDVKQSIYRFRNSDASMLDHELEEDKSLMHYVGVTTADTNYRSAPEIIEFNNNLFFQLGKLLPQTSVYDYVHQNPRGGAPDGYVKIVYDKEAKDDMRLNAMLEDIRRQVDPDKGNYKPGDITVLARTRSQASKIVAFLVQNTAPGQPLEGTKVLSDEALYINSSVAVQYIVEFLRKLITPQVTESQLQSSYYLEGEMTWFSQHLRQLRDQGMDSEEALQQAINDLHAQRIDLSRPPKCEGMEGKALFELVEMLISNLPNEEWRSEQALYLCAFQDFVLEFCQQPNPTIHDFIELWDQVKDKKAIGLDSGVNAIKVMTIHKSKGLEFPCVHIPLMDSQLTREEDYRWLDASEAFANLNLGCPTPAYFPIYTGKSLLLTYFKKQFEELEDESRFDEINSLYVAFTRAERELCVHLNCSESEKDNITKEIRFALGIEPSPVWEYVLGVPTVRRQSKKTTAQNMKISVPHYKVSRREDYWTFTEVDEEEI